VEHVWRKRHVRIRASLATMTYGFSDASAGAGVHVGETEQRLRNSLKSANFNILEPIKWELNHGVNHKVIRGRLIIRRNRR
jgi:hypothetical protein